MADRDPGTPTDTRILAQPGIEIYFSILQRKAINPNDFADLDQLSQHILAFQDRYNATATPFDWTYTRDDLNAFLRRLDLHDTPPTRTHAA
jgi:hypothetical protein